MSRRFKIALIAAFAGAILAAGCGANTETATTTTSTTELPASTSTSQPAPATTTTIVAGTTTTTPIGDVGHLLVVGDWGSGTLPQGAVAGAMMRHAEANEVDAILTTGDNFYSDDAEFLIHPFGWVLEAGTPFWITWGNHDVDSDARIEAVNETFGDPPRWTTHQWGEILVVILDSTQIESDEQVDFLAETLAASDDPTIVVFHHPVHSCGSHGSTTEILTRWVPLFDEDVFLVLNGHEHNYQRFEDDGTSYVVTGGGGAQLTELANCLAAGPEHIAAEMLHHFVVLEQGEGLMVSIVDASDEIIDEFVLELP